MKIETKYNLGDKVYYKTNANYSKGYIVTGFQFYLYNSGNTATHYSLKATNGEPNIVCALEESLSDKPFPGTKKLDVRIESVGWDKSAYADTVTHYEVTNINGLTDEEVKKQIGWHGRTDWSEAYYRNYHRVAGKATYEIVEPYLD